MKHADRTISIDSELAIKQVLQAERDAENAVRGCEAEAQQIIQDAQIRAQEIQSHVDQRITNMEMRHGHKLDKLIRSIESEGQVKLEQDISREYDEVELQGLIDKMAIELCQGDNRGAKADGDS